MESTKFTAGPWTTEEDTTILWDLGNQRQFFTRIYATDPGPDRDFTVGFSRDADPGVRAANARLLAAAPELYDALKLLLEADVYADGEGLVSISHSDTESGERAVRVARAAIAKAEARS